jgi:hypothetical protein
MSATLVSLFILVSSVALLFLLGEVSDSLDLGNPFSAGLQP